MKRIASLALVITGLLAAPSSAAAQAQSYEVDGARTLRDRIAIGATGAAIVEVDHGRCRRHRDADRGAQAAAPARVRGANRSRPPRQSAARRAHARRSRPPTPRTTTTPRWRPRSQAVADAYPAHRPALQHSARSLPGPRAVGGQDLRQRRHRRGRARGAVHRHQHAREHLTVEMALYLLNELTDEVRDRPADHEPRRLAARSGSCSSVNPDGGEYDIATGSLPARGARTASPTPARARSAPTSTATGRYRWGCCGGSSGTTRRRPTAAPSRVLGARDAAACATSSTRAWSAACSRSRPAIDFHTYSELVLWPFGYTTANTAPATDGRRPGDTSRDARPADGRRPTATRPSSRATSTSPTARSTTGCGAAHKIFAYTFEMYPRTSSPRLLPARRGDPARRRRRNRAAVLMLLESGRLPVPR